MAQLQSRVAERHQTVSEPLAQPETLWASELARALHAGGATKVAGLRPAWRGSFGSNKILEKILKRITLDA